jgi:phosphoribosylaminoimidazole-succinocarboxamide synthase
MSVDELISANITDHTTLATMTTLAQQVFGVLENAWQAHDVTLVDLKIEFGRTSTGELVVADVIDNDSWRLWQGGTSNNMLDKQIYRNMREVTPEGLERLRQTYLTVMQLTDQWR